ncbi:hypothetical protein FRC03_002631 [Tulasnella sp. 419]|nr:hypothetical protein FRC03_002631 [Tulasnella sp. 419]
MLIKTASLLLLVNSQILPTAAQLPLPSPPFLPPDKSNGYAGNGSISSSQQWTNLLGNLIWMYEAQRSGQLPSSNRVDWRNSSLVDDGSDSNMDLSGGYFDAGDYIKATYPLAFSLFSTCWGANVFGSGYDTANQTPYLDAMLRWGLDWLIKAHPSPNSLVVQLADTNVDNNYWGGDQNIPGPRPAFIIDNDHPGTDIAALTSAAFSACSALYAGYPLSPSTKPASLQNSTYASTLLTHATQLHDFYNSAPWNLYTDSLKKVTDFAYPGADYHDKAVLAELLLAVATAASGSTSGTSAQSYLDRATDYYDQFNLKASVQDVVLNWASMTPAIPVLLAQIASSNNSTLQPQGGLTRWQQESETHFDRVLNGKGRGKLTKGGLLWYDGDSDLASLNPAMNTAMMMMVYAGAGDGVATSADKKSDYLEFAERQLDYALGKNPMNVPYIVGVNPNSPQNPHDAKSSGGSNINAIDTDP